MNQDKIYHAALYCRLSKDDENIGDSTSIKTQKSLLESYCREQGFLIHDFYVDDGYSGLNYDRPDFQRMLTDIDGGKVNLVITKDLSRLGRDYIQTGYYTEIYFSRKKVRYIAANGDFDSLRSDNDIAPFKNILNDMYAKDLSRKVRAAKLQRAKNGYFISGQAPYGYKVNPDNHSQLIPDEAAGVVRDIFRMALEGLGSHRIAALLKERRVLNPSAYKSLHGDTRFDRYNDHQNPDKVYEWCYATIQGILRDRVYVGDMVNGKVTIINYKTKERVPVPEEQQIVVIDTHEPIVSREDFERVGQLMDARYTPQHIPHDHVFRGLLYCAECGHKMSLAHKPPRQGRRAYYRCMYHHNHPDRCKHTHAIYHEPLYDTILGRIRDMARTLMDDTSFYALMEKLAGPDSADTLTMAQRAKLEKRQGELTRLLRKLFEDNAAGLVSDGNYAAMMGAYQAEQGAVIGQLAALEKQAKKADDRAAGAMQLRAAIREYLDIQKLSPFILGKLVERIEVGHTEIVDGGSRQEVTVIWRFAGLL